MRRKSQARSKGKELVGTYSFWFRNHYNLAPNDPRFLGLTPDEIEADYWAHYFTNNPATERGEDDEEFNAEEVAALMESDDWIKVI